MTSLLAGYWAANYWPENHFNYRYWPGYGAVPAGEFPLSIVVSAESEYSIVITAEGGG